MADSSVEPFAATDIRLGRKGWVVVPFIVAVTLFVYIRTMAPGLTWANHGADGGELIAAAVQNGVPHPPGYPLYTLLLQGWLWLGKLLFPLAERAWLGNLFSALCASLSTGLTVQIAAHILALIDRSRTPSRSIARPWMIWGSAALTAFAWAFSPFFWGQALITEVYALHLLLTILLAWVLLIHPERLLWIVFAIALGIAHHLTFVLMLPAALYWLLFGAREMQPATSSASAQSGLSSGLTKQFVWTLLLFGGGGLIGLLFYLRIPLAASSGPPAVNWGYADSVSGFLWLVSADAYRPYLFSLPAESVFQRISAWAYMTVAQFTLVGLAVALLGLAYLDRSWTRLRTFTLLWGIPICIYAIGYHTYDSEIYLLPFFWIVALWFGIGLWLVSSFLIEWFAKRNLRIWPFLPQLIVLFLFVIWVATNWSTTSLHTDREAIEFLEEARTVIEPHSIIYSSADAETFALWYGAWGMTDPWQKHSTDEPVLINSALLQFEWYQRLLAERYPQISGMDQLSLEQPLSQPLTDNIENRSIYFSEEPSYIPAEYLEAVGRFWRYREPRP